MNYVEIKVVNNARCKGEVIECLSRGERVIDAPNGRIENCLAVSIGSRVRGVVKIFFIYGQQINNG